MNFWDTGPFTHCRGCGKQLPQGTTDAEDGFCSAGPPYCFSKFRNWAQLHNTWAQDNSVYFNTLIPNTAQYQVLIDEWLEKGAP